MEPVIADAPVFSSRGTDLQFPQQATRPGTQQFMPAPSSPQPALSTQLFVPPRSVECIRDGVLRPPRVVSPGSPPTASVVVTGVDLNQDGIPDALQQQQSPPPFINGRHCSAPHLSGQPVHSWPQVPHTFGQPTVIQHTMPVSDPLAINSPMLEERLDQVWVEWSHIMLDRMDQQINQRLQEFNGSVMSDLYGRVDMVSSESKAVQEIIASLQVVVQDLEGVKPKIQQLEEQVQNLQSLERDVSVVRNDMKRLDALEETLEAGFLSSDQSLRDISAKIQAQVDCQGTAVQALERYRDDEMSKPKSIFNAEAELAALSATVASHTRELSDCSTTFESLENRNRELQQAWEALKGDVLRELTNTISAVDESIFGIRNDLANYKSEIEAALATLSQENLQRANAGTNQEFMNEFKAFMENSAQILGGLQGGIDDEKTRRQEMLVDMQRRHDQSIEILGKQTQQDLDALRAILSSSLQEVSQNMYASQELEEGRTSSLRKDSEMLTTKINQAMQMMEEIKAAQDGLAAEGASRQTDKDLVDPAILNASADVAALRTEMEGQREDLGAQIAAQIAALKEALSADIRTQGGWMTKESDNIKAEEDKARGKMRADLERKIATLQSFVNDAGHLRENLTAHVASDEEHGEPEIRKKIQHMEIIINEHSRMLDKKRTALSQYGNMISPPNSHTRLAAMDHDGNSPTSPRKEPVRSGGGAFGCG